MEIIESNNFMKFKAILITIIKFDLLVYFIFAFINLCVFKIFNTYNLMLPEKGLQKVPEKNNVITNSRKNT